MTIENAIKSGVEKIRKPFWNKQAYLKLNLANGPWIELHDPCIQKKEGPEQILLFYADDKKDDWEAVL